MDVETWNQTDLLPDIIIEKSQYKKFLPNGTYFYLKYYNMLILFTKPIFKNIVTCYT